MAYLRLPKQPETDTSTSQRMRFVCPKPSGPIASMPVESFDRDNDSRNHFGPVVDAGQRRPGYIGTTLLACRRNEEESENEKASAGDL